MPTRNTLPELFTDIADAIRDKLNTKDLTMITDASCSEYINNTFSGTLRSFAFNECASLQKVIFNKCTSIGIAAFSNCMSLYNAIFPECTNIDRAAFWGCSSLQNISFPKCSYINGMAFTRCASLQYVNFPECTSIHSQAFFTTQIPTVSFPKYTLKESEYYDIFYWPSNITFGNISIDAKLIYADSGIQTINFPSCTHIGNEAFYSCTSLQSISFPVCTNIGSSAFKSCTSLQSVNFPKCTNIYGNAFYNCTSLQSVDFPVCTSISLNAFYNCTSLRSVNTPLCSIIDEHAFLACYNLLSVYLTSVSTVTTLVNSNAFESTPIDGYTTSTGGVYGSVYVPMSLVDAFKTAENWSYFSDRIVGV